MAPNFVLRIFRPTEFDFDATVLINGLNEKLFSFKQAIQTFVFRPHIKNLAAKDEK